MQASASSSQFSCLLDLPGELRMKIYKFTFAGSELIVRAQALSGDHRWRQGMRDWEHAWYSFHDTRHREEDLEASWYPMALTQTSVILRREAQPVLAAATCLLAIDVDARIALSRIPPHVSQHVRSFTSFGGPYIGYARHAHMDDLDPFVASDLPRLEQVRTHEIHENADGPYLDELIKAKYRSLKRLRGLKRWHLCSRQLSALTRPSEHPFVGLRAIAGHASFSFKQVVHIFGIWPGPNYPHHEEVHGCLHITWDVRSGQMVEVYAGYECHDQLWDDVINGDDSWTRAHRLVV